MYHLYQNKEMQSKIILNLCCCHLMKTISDNVFKNYDAVRKSNKNKNLARAVVGFVTPAFNLKTTNDLDHWFKAFSTIILSPGHTENVQQCIDYLIWLNNNCDDISNSDKVKDIQKSLFTTDTAHIDDLKRNIICNKPRYNASKFFCHFREMSENVKKSFLMVDESIPNKFYNEQYFGEFMGSVVAVIPMWTCLTLYNGTGEFRRPNNSGAELWFL